MIIAPKNAHNHTSLRITTQSIRREIVESNDPRSKITERLDQDAKCPYCGYTSGIVMQEGVAYCTYCKK